MRVCLITSAPFPPREGLGYHVWNLAQHLAQAGHSVDIVTRGGRRTRREELPGATPGSIPITLWRVAYAPLYPFHVHLHGIFVDRLLADLPERYDVINAHSPLPPVVHTRTPLVTTVHSPMRHDTAATPGRDLHALLVRLQTPVSRRIEAGLFRRSAAITAVASWVTEALAGYGVDPGRVTVTGNGVEDRFFENGAGPREPFVLYAGRVESGKGLEDLVAAARIMVDCRPDAADPKTATPGTSPRFVVAGAGPLLPRIQALASEAGLGDRFHFTGLIDASRREELARLYRTAAIFALPSHHEGMPTVLLEAMAAGAPVVSTRVGGAPEVVADGENGLLVPPREPEALAAALLKLWDAPKLRDALGAKARQTVAGRYSWRAIADRYLACYRQAVEEF